MRFVKSVLGPDFDVEAEESENFGEQDNVLEDTEESREMEHDNEDTEFETYEMEGDIAVLDSIVEDF